MCMYQNERSDDFPLDFPRFVHRVYLQRVTFVLMNKMNKMNKILFIMFCCFFIFIYRTWAIIHEIVLTR